MSNYPVRKASLVVLIYTRLRATKIIPKFCAKKLQEGSHCYKVMVYLKKRQKVMNKSSVQFSNIILKYKKLLL